MASCSRGLGVVVEAESVAWISVRRFVVGVLVVSIATVAVVMVRWSTSGNVLHENLSLQQQQVVPQLHQQEGVKVVFEAACRATRYREVCMQTLLPNSRSHVATPDGLAAVLIGSAAQGVTQTLAAVLVDRGVDRSGFAGERVCHSTLVSSVEQLNAAVDALKSQTYSTRNRALYDEIQTRLLAASEFQKTCIDALLAARALEPHVEAAKEHAEKLLHNARAAFAALSRFGPILHAWAPIAQDDSLPSVPSWVTNVAQELLNEQLPSDVVVAKDGSAQFKSIQSAIDAATETSVNFTNRYVVYVKAGVYNEQVIIPKAATGIVLLGDGPGVTIITGNRSVDATPGVTTFFSPTLIVEGAGFIGKGFTARNTAGAAGNGGRKQQQAVAMRVSADMATFFQCEFDGGQDALHTHTFRQLYRHCTITGPDVDRFVLGHAAIATFQSCSMVATS